MVFTMLLLGALYAVFTAILVRSGVSLPLVGAVVGGIALAQFHWSDRLVLLSTGARLCRPGEWPEVREMLERLAAMAGLPPPRLARMETPMPNAFATGRDPGHAVVAVTTGLLQQLPPAEVEAVLGHELTHVRHRDMAVMAFASFFATIAGWMVQNLYWLGLFGGWGGGVGGQGGGGRRSRGESLGMLILVSWLVYAASFLLIAALSRYREYAADRGSALLTGQPAVLASALIRISDTMKRIPSEDLRRVQHANALFVLPAAPRHGGPMELLMTHPTLEHRLDRLRRIEAELSRH